MNKYSIEPVQLSTFINNKYLFPRFQRKVTWNNSQNFELCISIFQGYPMGVCIVNNTDSGNYLLDGRQRRNCIQTLTYDQVSFYNWAKKYCKFTDNSSEIDITENFKSKLLLYLGQNEDDNSEEKTKTPEGRGNEENSIVEDESIDLSRVQKEGFDFSSVDRLLKLILMMHPFKDWNKAFNFTKYFQLKTIEIIYDKDKTEINPLKFCTFIRQTSNDIKDKNQFSKNKFKELLERKWSLIGEGYDITAEQYNKVKFEEHVDQYWEIIKKNYEGIEGLEGVLQSSRIGIIQLAGLNALDAQNIFKRINSGGTQLTSAELLSAEPYWNKPIEQTVSERQIIESLYRKLDLPFEKACRWDVPATLIHRIDPSGVFFYSKNITDEDKKFVDSKEISYGFNIFSSVFADGVSKVCLSNISKKTDIWDDKVPTFIEDMKNVVSIIKEINGFKVLLNWSKNISDILGATPAIEFLTISYLNWINKDRPKNGTKYSAFKNDVKNHFDRLLREKMQNIWGGSADSTLADDIKPVNWPSRITAITDAEHDTWNDLIQKMRDGKINDKVISEQKMVLPILYYAKMIEDVYPLNIDNGKNFDIDHIYPQNLFQSNSNADSKLMNSISNLELLETSVNKAKKNRKLKEVSSDIKNSVSAYSGIDVDDFEKYSDINNFQSLDNLRGEKYSEIFDSKRKAYLSNN